MFEAGSFFGPGGPVVGSFAVGPEETELDALGASYDVLIHLDEVHPSRLLP